MRINILIKYLIIILLTILQLSFFKGLGWPWFNVNLLLTAAVFLIVSYGLDNNLIPLIAGALILDLFSGAVFGVITISILLSCFLINFVYLYLFTNKTLSSLVVLGVIGGWSYVFFITIFNYFFNWLNLTAREIVIDKMYWYNLAWQTFFMILFLVIIYWLNKIFVKQELYINQRSAG